MNIKREVCAVLAVAVALAAALAFVPAQGALAASVEIEIQPSPDEKETSNILVRPTSGSRKVRVRLLDYDYEGSAQYNGLYFELVQPDGSIARGMTVSDKLAMGRHGNTYSYELEMTSRQMTGLYSINVYPYKGGMHLTDGAGRGIPAFYYAVEGGAALDASASSFTPMTKYSPAGSIAGAQQVYMARGGNVQYAVRMASYPSGVSSMNIKLIDPVTGKFFARRERAAAGTTMREAYTVGDAADGARMQFKVLAVSHGDNGEQVCQLHTLAEQLTGNGLEQVTIDAAGPEVGAIKISNPAFYKKEQDGFMYAQIPGNPTTYVEVGSITDRGAGVSLDDGQSKSYVRFINAASPSHMVGSSGGADQTRLSASGASAPVYHGAAGAAMAAMELSGRHRTLVDGQWRMQVVAADTLGNETVKDYGRIVVYNKYTEVNHVRVEQYNVLDMYVGQQLTFGELEQRGIRAAINKDASFPDAWTWSITAGMSNIVDYNADTGILTAKKAGEGRISAIALSRYEGDNARGSDYLSIRVAAEPPVNSLALDPTELQLKPGKSAQVKAAIDPDYAKIKWESKDEAVATVDGSGRVTAVGDGATAVVASSGEFVVTCTVLVKSDPVAKSIAINKERLRLGTGQGERLYANTTPQGLPVEWASSDTGIATVDKDGNVSALREGTATITARSGIASASCELTVYRAAKPNTWSKDDEGRWVYYDERSNLTMGWKKIGNVWYLFDNSTGIMKTGWAKDGNTWYYLMESGAMKTGWLRDGYDARGNARWYYLSGSGAMATGWQQPGGSGPWYYFHSSGLMATGWVKVGGTGASRWYYMDKSGEMFTGWLREEGSTRWYYLGKDGAMLTGTHTIDGRRSRFDASGMWLGYV